MFKFKGISNEQMKVIPVEEDFQSRASIIFEAIEIEGKDGADYIPLGYADVEKELSLQILDTTKIDDIMAWLTGEGFLEYEGRQAFARFYSGFDVNRFVSLKKAEVNYIRSPFWYKIDDPYAAYTILVTNEGNIYSKPLIKLTGTGIVDISVNGTRFQYTFDTDPYVEIDCEVMTEKYDGISKSRQISIGLEYPKLQPGANNIQIHSGNAIVEIKRKDRWL